VSLLDTASSLRLPTAPGCLINGTWELGAGEKITVLNPATEETLMTVQAANLDQVDRATAAARANYVSGAWAGMSPKDRSRRMHELVDLFESRRDYFAELTVAEVGTPIRITQGLQIQFAIDVLRWFADKALEGPRGGWEELMGLHDTPILSGSLLVREPAGVVAAITAYNTPLLLLGRKLGPALAAGCSTVLMPSPRAPLSTIAFFEMLDEIDLPPGTVNLALGGPEVGQRLTESPDVDVVSFTGSHTVGSQVMRQASASLKRVTLELGGKSPNIVLPGADLDAAVRPSMLRFALNSGQGCGCTTRTLVAREAYDEFVERSKDVLAGLVVGDPTDPTTDLGPLIRAEQRDFVQGHIDGALAGGASIVAGTPRTYDRGFFVDPMVIGGVANTSVIAQTELFGPIGVVIPFDTLDEAVEIANDTSFGLNANVWGVTSQAMALARRVRSGTVTINGGGGMRPDAPWGGYGLSGLGREGGEDGFLEYLETKHIQWPIDGKPTKPFGTN
jgi:aldehyde dehydrogenase (NAD+)